MIWPIGAIDQNTISDWMAAHGWYIIGIIVLVVITLYGFTFLKRLIRYLKIKESKYMDADILDFLEISIKVIWSLIVLFTCILLLGLAWIWFKDNVYDVLVEYAVFASVMSVVILVIVVGLLIKFSHHIMQYMAGNFKEKPEKTMNPRIALLIELFLKYFLIAFGAILIITIGLSAIGYYEKIIGDTAIWLNRNKTKIVFIIVAMILAFFFAKVLETFFEDMKKKETPFTPQIMDAAKVLSKYAIYLIVGVAVIFSFLDMFELGNTGLLIDIMIIVLLTLVVAVIATSDIRNGFSGILIMYFKPFTEGDRVKVLDHLVCDVVSLNLIFTKVKTLQGELVDIPNKEILERPIFNFTKSSEFALSATVLVPSDIERSHAEEIMLSAVKKTEGILSNQEPQIYSVGLEKNFVVYEILAYTSETHHIRKIRSNLIFNIVFAFKEDGVEVSATVTEDMDRERSFVTKPTELVKRRKMKKKKKV